PAVHIRTAALQRRRSAIDRAPRRGGCAMVAAATRRTASRTISDTGTPRKAAARATRSLSPGFSRRTGRAAVSAHVAPSLYGTVPYKRHLRQLRMSKARQQLGAIRAAVPITHAVVALPGSAAVGIDDEVPPGSIRFDQPVHEAGRRLPRNRLRALLGS